MKSYKLTAEISNYGESIKRELLRRTVIILEVRRERERGGSLNRCGLLRVDYAPSEVGVKYGSDVCVLSYSCHDVANSQVIDFHETPCHFGGSRKWFVCHECKNKVSKLRFFGMSFICGKCVGLGYKSQRINRVGRLQNRAAKIKDELGMDMPASLCRFVKDFDRPKGMHWSTFKRQQIRANNYLIEAIRYW